MVRSRPLPPGVGADRTGQEPTTDQRAQHKAIADGLRAFYDTVAAEPIPDEFTDLLKKLSRDEPGSET